MARAFVRESSAITQAPPYAPSWFDHFKAWVERLPVSVWLFYIVLSVVFVAVEFSVQWQAGNLPFGTFTPYHTWYVLQSVYLLGVVHYLDKTAASAFDVFVPALELPPQEIAALRYKLTHLPARPALLVTLAVTVTAPFWLVPTRTTYAQLYLESSPVVFVVNIFFYLLSFALGGFTVYHAIHQLRTISETYGKLSNINLFQLRPLYALSGVTVRTALGFVVYMMLWGIALPGTFDNAASLAMAIPLSMLALITFLVPLWGIHQRLRAEQEHCLGESGLRMTQALEQFHHAVATNATEQALKTKDLVAALEYEYNLYAKIPTWPWQPDTFRLIISALLLPFVLFLIQFVISRWLTP